MKTIYHALFESHLQYGTQLWRQGNCGNQNNIQKLQNRKKIGKKLKTLHNPVNPLNKGLEILQNLSETEHGYSKLNSLIKEYFFNKH